jgi:DNA-binding phage protein
MKTTNKKLHIVRDEKKLKWYSFDQVFSKAAKTREFKNAYNEEMNRIRLAKQLKDIREKKNLTQLAVARKTAMPQSVIARIESGSHSVSLDTLNKVAHALGKRVELV